MIKKTTLLLTDTICFVSRLPTYIIEVFKSTSEKWLTADLVLSFDSSEALQDIGINNQDITNARGAKSRL
jgi:50S ribosomal subunit-associated GTPase HflX